MSLSNKTLFTESDIELDLALTVVCCPLPLGVALVCIWLLQHFCSRYRERIQLKFREVSCV